VYIVPISLEYKDVENKLLILYLINRMELSMSNAQVTDFVITKDFMNHLTLGQVLADMLDQNLLEATQENALDVKSTRYTITNKGLTSLEYFENHIPRTVRSLINQYVEDKRGEIKRDYEISANYFPDAENNDFQVKCGIYEDKRALIELSISVDTREQVKLILANWRSDASVLYERIIAAVTTPGSSR